MNSNNKQNMKNTMKIKSLLSFFVPAAMMSLMVASCSDYDNGYDTNAIKFTEQFKKTFGDIDPEQDWNLAERGTVTVSTQKESEVKIYALSGDEYIIVGDYEGVKGTQELGFDMVEGTKNIIVTDGVTAQQTVPSGAVSFGGTRFTVYEGTREGVTVERFTNETEINGVKYRAQKTPSQAEMATVLAKVPEREANLNNVTNNFYYVSTGSFVIYPYYWNTSSVNTLGVYYTDANNEYHEVDIYTLNGEDRISETYTDDNHGWSISNTTFAPDGSEVKFGRVASSNVSDESGITAPFMEFWRHRTQSYFGALGNADISKTFSGFNPGKRYVVEVKARLMNETNTDEKGGTVTFKANDKSIVMTNEKSSTKAILHRSNDCRIVYSDMNGLKKMWLICNADNNGNINVSFELRNVDYNWFAFNDLKIFYSESMNTSSDGNNFYDSPERGKGIRVDIPNGTKFGMYLKKSDINTSGVASPFTFYSEKYKNDYNVVGNGVKVEVVDGKNKNIEVENSNPCYASTFKMPGQEGNDKLFLSFEDWPNTAHSSDFDMNDVVFAFDGCTPIIINEDPENSSWLLACEDLGGSFDIDYNDLVFSVEHISGQKKAKLTPLAAGGTLASYIYYEDPKNNSSRNKCFGEIHQLFGATPVKSGEYDIINARSRYEKTANSIEFDVDEGWTMAYYSIGEAGGENYGGDVNMGGFEIRTLTLGKDAPFTLDINSGDFSGASVIQPAVRNRADNVPYILCIPYPYTRYNYNRTTAEAGKKTDFLWAWPTEYTTICNEKNVGPYPDFAGWVRDHTKNTDWYKNKDYVHASAATVEDVIVKVSAMTQTEIINHSNNNNTKQECPLRVNYNANFTLTAGNTSINLNNYILTESPGAITFTIYTLDRSQHMGADSDGTFNFYNGSGIVVVHQDAGGNYQAGDLEFTITVGENNNNNNNDDNNNNTQTGDWVTLTNQGSVYGNGSSYLLSEILDACGSGSKVEFKVEGNNEGYITLILIGQDGNPNWSYVATNNQASGETLIVDKTTLQGWVNSGVGTKVFMQNPSTSVQVRWVQ